MATGQGLTSRCALGVETTWGTGVAVTELLPFNSESIDRVIAQIMSEYLTGLAGVDTMRGSSVSVQGDIGGDAVWDTISTDPIGMERLIRGAMGDSARDSGNSLNQYFFAASVDDSYTIAFNKTVSAWELTGVKVGQLEISGAAGEPIKWTVTLVAENLQRTGDAGITNAISAITALSYTTPTQIIFDDLTFRLADQANAIAAGDQVSIANFSFKINNNISDPQFESGDANHADSTLTLEPLRNGLKEVTLDIELPRYTTDALFDWHNDSTALQADLKFSSGSYEFNILLPNLKIVDSSAQIGGPELIAPTYNMRVLRNNGVNTDMTFQDTDVITDEAGIECKSDRTSAA